MMGMEKTMTAGWIAFVQRRQDAMIHADENDVM